MKVAFRSVVASLSFASVVIAANVPECVGMQWAYNSLEQSPCDMASYLTGVCRTDGLNGDISSLLPGWYYIAGNLGFANPCRCNTVIYSLLSACALCQSGVRVSGWSLYSTNCTSEMTSLGSFPLNIPSGTKIPHWAYLDVTARNNFSESSARDNLDAPESIATDLPSPTTNFPSSATNLPNSTPNLTSSTTKLPSSITNLPSSTTNNLNSTTNLPSSIINLTSPTTELQSSTTDLPGIITDLPSSTTFPIPTGSHGGSNTGVIAGCAVGGFAFLAIIVGLIFWFIRRRKKATLESTTGEKNTVDRYTQYPGYDPAGQHPASSQPFPKKYDPSDPRTFPVEPYALHTSHSSGKTGIPPDQRPNQYSVIGSGGGYSGRPEV